MPRYRVQFLVVYEGWVDADNDKKAEDAACDLDIPENEDARYVTDSFRIVELKRQPWT